MGSRPHRQPDRDVQRRSSHAGIRLHFLLDKRADYCGIPGRDGIDGSNVRRAISLGLHAWAS